MGAQQLDCTILCRGGWARWLVWRFADNQTQTQSHPLIEYKENGPVHPWHTCLAWTPKSSIFESGMVWYSEGPSSGGLCVIVYACVSARICVCVCVCVCSTCLTSILGNTSYKIKHHSCEKHYLQARSASCLPSPKTIVHTQ